MSRQEPPSRPALGRLARLLLGVGALFALCARTAHADGTDHRRACVVAAELACGDGARLLVSGPALPLALGTQLTAENQDEWEDLWRYLGLPGPEPRVEFRDEYVVAFVDIEPGGCGPGHPGLLVCRDGAIELSPTTFEICMSGGPATEPEPRRMWIFAVSRSRLASAMQAHAAEPASRASDAACTPALDQAELWQRKRARHALASKRSWLEKLDWQAAAGALAGISPSRGGLVGAELRAGRRDQRSGSIGDGFTGNLIGLDLRARWLLDPNTAHPHHFSLGLWPWLMMSHDWVFHRHFSRQPTFMNLVVPEGGIVFNHGIGGYLGWSFPIMLRPLIYFYRASPYVLAEHSAFEFAPGVLWLFEPNGQSVTFTLSVSAGLW